jgi:acetyltransferase-like isoleucine patch superfamily enzyme
MLSFSNIRQSLLESALSFSAAVNGDATGNTVQGVLLKLMGMAVVGPVAIGREATFLCPRRISLGRYVSMGVRARLVGWDEITIGDDFMAGDHLTINAGGHDPETLRSRTAPVRIGARVWCGTNVTICQGVTIGDDVVIGAGATVVRDLPSGVIAAGVPAKTVRELRRDPAAQLWSAWPERCGDGRYERSGAFVRMLYRLRTRI